MFGEDTFEFRSALTFLGTPGYEEGFWRGKRLSELETSHLANIKAMLEKYKNGARSGEAAQEYSTKLVEIDDLIENRSGEVITQHEYRITEEDLIALARSKGVKIPKSGAGIYIGSRGNYKRLSEVYLRFDTTQKIKQPDIRKGKKR